MNEYVYIIKDIDVTGYCKIGRTKNFNRRLSELGVKLPFRTKTLYILRCVNGVEFEAFLHDKFLHTRKRGEWFDLGKKEFDYLDAMIAYSKAHNNKLELFGFVKTAVELVNMKG